MMRIPAYGSSGPYKQARALGVHLESVLGHTLIRGYADADPSENSAIYSGDYLAGAQTALAVMMAVWHRDKTGDGQLIEMGQAENASAMLAHAFMDYALNGRLAERLGNRSVYGFAPTGVYPTQNVGTVDDQATAGSRSESIRDDEWRALKQAMGEPAWAADASLDTNAGRLAAHDAIDAKLAEWTSTFDDYALFHKLQSAGVSAAPVWKDRAPSMTRRWWRVGCISLRRCTAASARTASTPVHALLGHAANRAPAAGRAREHNEYVYKEILGFTDAEYQQLVDQGDIGMDFDASIP